MPLVTVCLGSSRPGGLDISLYGLARQTFRDFEVVFVDGRYGKRKGRVAEAVRESGLSQPFYHVPNYRSPDGPWGVNCAGYNTGFALAAGEIVVILLDYAYVQPDWLEHHVKHAGTLVLGPHRYRKLVGAVAKDGKPLTEFERNMLSTVPFDVAMDAIAYQRTRIDEVSCFAEPWTVEKLEEAPIEHVSVPLEETQATEPYWMSTKNESFPRANVFACNGMREIGDHGRVPCDPDLGYRLHWSGLEPWYVHETMVDCLNPRGILPNMNLVQPESGTLPPPYDKRISVETGNALYNVWRQSEQIRAENTYTLAELRDKLWPWREMALGGHWIETAA